MTNLDSVLKSRDITLPTKVHLIRAMGFPVVMHGCESWSRKKAEHRRTDAFEPWCWRRLLRVPWTAREVMKTMATSFKRSPAGTVYSVSMTLQQATLNLPFCRRPLDTYRQVWVSLLRGHCSFPLDPGAHKVLCKQVCLPSPV